MTTLRSLIRVASACLVLTLAGCASSAEDPEDGAAEAAEAVSGTSGPTVVEIEKPLDLDLGHTTFNLEEDWSRGRVEVLQSFGPDDSRWVPANKTRAPNITSTIKDGFGSGPCRLKVNPFKKEVGFRCRWQF